LGAALIAGCTATFTYNHLDWLIPWFVDGYVDLTREQRKGLEGRLEPLLRWHRDEELVRYIDILDRIERQLAAPVTAADVQGWIDDILSAAERTERSMLSLALDFGTTISDEQMAEFVANLWERQRDYEVEFLERSDEHDAEQKSRLRAAAVGLRRFDSVWLDERTLWLKKLEPLLQREPGWAEAVQAAYSARKITRTPQYNATLAHNLGVINRAVADVLNGLSPGQRKHMAKEFDDLRGRLKKLMAKPHLARAATQIVSVTHCLTNQMVVEADGLQVDIDRDILIDTMDGFDSSRVRGNRQEPIHIGRQPVKIFRIGATTHHVGSHQRAFIHGANGARQQVIAA
jgi:hypothetical protein